MNKNTHNRLRGLQAIRYRLTLVLLFSVFAILASIKATLMGIFPT